MTRRRRAAAVRAREAYGGDAWSTEVVRLLEFTLRRRYRLGWQRCVLFTLSYIPEYERQTRSHVVFWGKEKLRMMRMEWPRLGSGTQALALCPKFDKGERATAEGSLLRPRA
jgi:hypothetical protein